MKNRYIGKWTEPLSETITLPFSVESLSIVLGEGEKSKEERRFTHHDIAHWCDRFWKAFDEIDAPEEIEKIMPVLADVEAQWDMYLANTYKLKELQNLNFGEVELPRSWFSDWKKELAQPGSPYNSSQSLRD